MHDGVVVVGVGVVTAVGLTARETAAAVRAGVARFGESAIRGRQLEPRVLAEIPEDGLPALADGLDDPGPLTGREARVLRIAAVAIREALAPLAGQQATVGLCFALPEYMPKTRLDPAALVARLAAQTGRSFDPALTDASNSGRAGGIAAIGRAVAALLAGQAELMLAGSADSYRDPYVLDALDLEARLRTGENLDGFIPGEGGGFVLLSTARTAAARGLTPVAALSPAATGFESGHLYSPEPYRGDGLATTLAQLISTGAVSRPIAEVYSSMNGESHWAKEWGVGYVRNRAAFRPDHGIHHPADSFGDTGAASGPIMVGLSALGIRGGYRSPPSLVYGSSDRGARSAIVLDGIH